MNSHLLNKKTLFAVWIIAIVSVFSTLIVQATDLEEKVINALKDTEIARAKAFLTSIPVTVTDAYCVRSAGGIHDFYSEGDYWWPNPENPGGAYQQRDGQTGCACQHR